MTGRVDPSAVLLAEPNGATSRPGNSMPAWRDGKDVWVLPADIVIVEGLDE